MSLINKKRMMIEKVVFGLAILAVVGGFIFAAVKLKDNSSNQAVSPVNALAASDWIKGDKDAKIILIEYSDFQCPACAAYAPMVKQIAEEFGEKVAFAYRHFPLFQHKNAELAAMASEAAGRQNKFWETHDMIFENQEEWAETDNAEEIFIKYAENLGLNIEQFKNDLTSKELKDQVKIDLRSGNSARVNATPTFFLNGEKISPQNYEDFKEMIEFVINKQ